MIDFNFSDGLIHNRFPSDSTYYFTNLYESNVLLLNPKMVPLVKLQGNLPEPKKPLNNLTYNKQLQFRGKQLNKEKILEIVNSAHYPMTLKITDVWYYIGKGFIALKDPASEDMIPLMVAVVPESNYTLNRLSDITLLVDRRYKDQVPIIQYVIKQCVIAGQGDLINTSNIIKHLAGTIKLPVFTNIRAKKEFTEHFVENCIAAL